MEFMTSSHLYKFLDLSHSLCEAFWNSAVQITTHTILGNNRYSYLAIADPVSMKIKTTNLEFLALLEALEYDGVGIRGSPPVVAPPLDPEGLKLSAIAAHAVGEGKPSLSAVAGSKAGGAPGWSKPGVAPRRSGRVDGDNRPGCSMEPR